MKVMLVGRSVLTLCCKYQQSNFCDIGETAGSGLGIRISSDSCHKAVKKVVLLRFVRGFGWHFRDYLR